MGSVIGLLVQVFLLWTDGKVLFMERFGILFVGTASIPSTPTTLHLPPFSLLLNHSLPLLVESLSLLAAGPSYHITMSLFAHIPSYQSRSGNLSPVK